MELIRNNWTKEDTKEFTKYLKTFENFEKKEWCTNILQTHLPVLCIKTPIIKDIVNKIYKGNYLKFLNYMLWNYYENTAINGFLISKIKDFNTRKKYLDIYSAKIDNWASCDLLTFNVEGNEEPYFNLSREYINSNKPFVRRIGMYILFDFINNDKYINKIYKMLDKFNKEENYYVNMMNAWLLSDLFVKRRELTIKYLDNNKLNTFTMNKFISKCRDSYRITKEDKEMLIKYKVR